MLVDITPAQVSYLNFLVAHKLEKEEKDYLSQNQAYKRFGEANIKRWVDRRKVQRYKRPNTVEYKLRELLQAAETVQDYL